MFYKILHSPGIILFPLLNDRQVCQGGDQALEANTIESYIYGLIALFDPAFQHPTFTPYLMSHPHVGGEAGLGSRRDLVGLRIVGFNR